MAEGAFEPVSNADIKNVVAPIVHSSDLSQITARTVREAVVKQFGKRLGDDQKEIKKRVKGILDEVLADPAPPTEATAEGKSDVPTEGAVEGGVEKKTEKDVEKPLKNTAEPIEAPAEPSAGSKNVDDAKGKDADVDNEDTANGDAKAPPKKRSRKPIVHEDIDDDFEAGNAAGSTKKAKSDSDFEASDADEKPAGGKVRGKKRKSTNSDYGADAVAENSDGSESDAKPKVKKQRKKHAPRGSATKPAPLSAKEIQLKKYMKAARSIGCRVGPSNLKNKSVAEKVEVVVAHLARLDFDVKIASNFTKAVLAEFKAKNDQEKELASLDVG